ncbi:MAG: hypothetical protein HY892_12195, partial [Deltaproteobacteria bacterium]|nr:hypothetical protein [Deltaproteobacteria bacterium]
MSILNGHPIGGFRPAGLGQKLYRIFCPLKTDRFILPLTFIFSLLFAAPLLGQTDPSKEIGDPNNGIYIRYAFSGYTVTSQGRGYEYKGEATTTPVRVSGIIRISMPGMTITQGSMSAKGVIGMSTLQNIQWPPKGDEGWVGKGAPRRTAEMPFDISVPIKPGQAGWISIGGCMKGGTSDCISVMAEFTAPAGKKLGAPKAPDGTPTLKPALPPPNKTAATAGPKKPPCDEPLAFYPKFDVNSFYTGQPSLCFTREQFGDQLVNAMKQYASAGNSIVDGFQPMDVKDIAMTFTTDSTTKDGAHLAPTLQEASRRLAQSMQAKNPGYKLTPQDLFGLSLRVNKGNVRNALLTCHAALYRDKKGVNKGFVEREGVLTPMRNPDGYADKQMSYTPPSGNKRPMNPKALSRDEQGVWYHYFGVAALEYSDRYGLSSYYGAQAGIWWIGDTSKRPALDKISEKGFPVTELGHLLGNFAVALEEGIRDNAGSPPDIDKNCVNYAGLLAGDRLRAGVDQVTNAQDPTPGKWRRGEQFKPNIDRFTTLGGADIFKSPLSVRIEGTHGEWFSFDQTTKRFDGNAPNIFVYPFIAGDGTWGLVTVPMFEIAKRRYSATGRGPVQLAVYKAATRASVAFEFTVQPGDTIVVGPDLETTLNGRRLTPVGQTSRGSTPVPVPSSKSNDGHKRRDQHDNRGGRNLAPIVLDEVDRGSIVHWHERYDPAAMNPRFRVEEIASPYDGATAIQSSASGNTTATCETKWIRRIYSTGQQVTSGATLEAYLAFAFDGTRFNLPAVKIELLDNLGRAVGSRVYFGNGVIGSFNREQLSKTGYVELPTRNG